ncbi:MAG: hypothetical protein LBU30_00540 [Candidatus Methanoplasma sp.]|jgi:hypothetical protein|nr:hypothetical protein [Candidatus Methanoplasma sp.]
MVAKGQKRTALVLGLVWAAMAAIAYTISEIYGLNLYWYTPFYSLLLILAGLIISFGHIRIFFPFIFMSTEDLSGYNVEKIASVLGILIAVLSYLLLFISMNAFVLWMIIIVCITVEILATYASVAKRFKADLQTNNYTGSSAGYK